LDVNAADPMNAGINSADLAAPMVSVGETSGNKVDRQRISEINSADL
jgi:hypothetical protein